MTIYFLVASEEVRPQVPVQRHVGGSGAGQCNRDLVSLAHMAQIGLERKGHVVVCDAGGLQHAPSFRLQSGIDSVQLDQGRGIETFHVGARELERRRGGEEAQGRRDPGGRGTDKPLHLERPRNLIGMHRAGAPECHQAETAGIGTPFRDMNPGGRNHVLVDDPENPVGGFGDGQTHPVGQPGHRRFGRSPIQNHAPAEEETGVQIAQQQIGIRHGRGIPAHTVAGRARIGTGGIGTHLEQSKFVDPGHGSAAGSNLDQFDGRYAHRKTRAALEAVHARNLKVIGHGRLPVLDETHLGGRAAHVERDQIGQIQQFAVEHGGQRPGRRPGFDQPDRKLGRGLQSRHPARGEHQEHLALESDLSENLSQLPEIGCCQRLHVRVAHRGRHAFVLPDFRSHLVRQGHAQLGQVFREPGAGLPFVLRVGEGMQEADRNRFDRVRYSGALQSPGNVTETVEGQILDYATERVHALPGFKPQRPGHQMLHLRSVQVVDVVAHLALGIQHVAESLCGQEQRHGTLALDQAVGDQSRAVDGVRNLGAGKPGFGQQRPPAGAHGSFRAARRGGQLVAVNATAGLVVKDKVRKRSADVETNSKSGHWAWMS